MASTPSADLAEAGESAINTLLASYLTAEKVKRTALSELNIQEISKSLEWKGRTEWSRVPRLYIVLRLIDQVQALDSFITLGISDIWFPFSPKTLPGCLTSPSARADFLELQYVVLTKALDLEREDGKHRHFLEEADIPMRKIGILGKGGFGFVERVVSSITHREYARKLLPRGKTFRKNSEVFKDFERELGHLKKLSHIHIVELIGSYTDPRYVGLIMSPVADCDLRTFLTRSILNDSERSLLRSFFGCLATALCYLHEKQIRHKDIKPQNILVKADRVLFTDFGISTDWSELSHSTTSGPTTKTLRYCAPEVAQNALRNTSSDVWSLGCVFLEIWTVLKGETIESLDTYLEMNGSNSKCYCLNYEACMRWCNDLATKTESRAENPPFKWICGILQSDKDARWASDFLNNRIQEFHHESEDKFIFCGSCCLEDMEDTQSSRSSSRFSQDMERTSASSVGVYYPESIKAGISDGSQTNSPSSSKTIRPRKPIIPPSLASERISDLTTSGNKVGRATPTVSLEGRISQSTTAYGRGAGPPTASLTLGFEEQAKSYVEKIYAGYGHSSYARCCPLWTDSYGRPSEAARSARRSQR